MRRILLCIALLGGVVTIPSVPAFATWVNNNCSPNHHEDSNYRRVDARAYVDIALKEGYEYGGGCWNNNDVDDTPGSPNSSGEGPDCSGLVFKAWELESSWGAGGFHWWGKLTNIHGPYASWAYHDAGTTTSLPFHRISKGDALYMDAFARDSHVGLLYSSVPTSSGTYRYAEAKGDAYGVHVFEESWMSDSAYVGVRRKGWTADCFPNCLSAPSSSVVVVR